MVVSERQFRDRQGRRAFAYLVCCRNRPVPRSELAPVIWPDEMPPAWEAALSAVVSRIRGLLRIPKLARFHIALTTDFGQYQLCLPADTWVDLEASARAIDEAEGALRLGDPMRAFGWAGVVYAIANRPFLAGDAGGWVDAQCRALERQYLRALDCLSAIWLLSGEPAQAVETASQAIAADPLRESSYRLLMRAHLACGDKAAAIRSYLSLQRLLVDELGVPPGAEIETLYLEAIGSSGG
jgi:DNA-binding SARP family transcriptional activator